MFKKSSVVVLFFVVSIFVLGAAHAYADPGSMGDGLVYGYYSVRSSSNYMVVTNSTTTSSCTIPAPVGKKAFTYTPVELPVVSCDPAKAKPIGVGSIAHGGNTIELTVDIGPFEEPVDVSFGLFAASFDASDIYFLNIFNEITSLQEEFAEESNTQVAANNGNGNGHGNGNDNGNGNGNDNGNGNGNDQGSNQTKPKKNFKKLIAWKSNVLGVTETIAGPIDASDFPPGLYVLVLNVTRVSPAEDNFDRFYRWVTYFIVPDPSQ